MGFRRKGGVLIIHHVCWNGEVEIIMVPAGEQYIADVPSGGLFAMTVCPVASTQDAWPSSL